MEAYRVYSFRHLRARVINSRGTQIEASAFSSVSKNGQCGIRATVAKFFVV